MKRSEINRALRELEAMWEQHRCRSFYDKKRRYFQRPLSRRGQHRLAPL